MNNAMFDLTGKKAVIVGGAGDLGQSMVEGLAACGAQVAIIGRGERTKAAVQTLCGQGYKAHAVLADIADRAKIDASFAEALRVLGGRVDILLNTAGVQRRHPAETFPLSDWDEVIAVNLTALYRYCQLAGAHMIENGYGKIINIASMLSFFGGFTVSAYAASKGGVAQLTKALSNEWASKGVNVNAIAPGYMDTKMNTALINDSGRNAEILGRIPQRRWGTGEDMKGAVVFLASAASDYVNGAIIPVDGGYLGK